MNSSIYSADRATHLRIIAVATVFSVMIAGFAAAICAGSTGMTQATAYPGHKSRPAIPTSLAARASTSPI